MANTGGNVVIPSGSAFLQLAPMTKLVPMAGSMARPLQQGARTSSTGTGGIATMAAGAAAAAGVVVGAGRKRARAGRMPKVSKLAASPSQTHEINYYTLDAVDKASILGAVQNAIHAAAPIMQEASAVKERLLKVLSEPSVVSMLISISRMPVFSHEMGSAFKDDLDLLLALKQIKYFWSVPQSQLAILLEQVARQVAGPKVAEGFMGFVQSLTKSRSHTDMVKRLQEELPAEARNAYMQNAEYLETADAHAVYLETSIYRQCATLLTLGPRRMPRPKKAVMSTTLTTTIKIARNVLSPSNRLLANVSMCASGPMRRRGGRQGVEALYGKELDAYFAHHGIEYKKLVFSGNEVDKDIRDVERILVALKESGQGRHEPLLIVGGGVIADVAGLVAALYSRSTPYVMLCTSIVSGVDAGPSPRVCCNGFDYENWYGAYHPPVLASGRHYTRDGCATVWPRLSRWLS